MAELRALGRPVGSGHKSVVAALAAAVAASLVFWLWLALRIGGTSSVRTVDDLGTVAAALVAAVLCVRAGLASQARLRRFWLLLGAASVSWTAAEIVWAVYDLVLRVPPPAPSWADVGYLGALPLAIAALVSHPSIRGGRPRRVRATLDALAIATASLFLSWSILLGPLWSRSDLSTFGGVVDIAYPFGDVVMVSLVLLVVRAAGARWRVSLFCVLAGVMAMALADSAYTYLSEIGSYATGNVVDVGWVVAYLGIGLGAYCSHFEERERGSSVVPEAANRDPVVSIVAPVVAVLVALLVVAGEGISGRPLDRVEWLMALTLTLLVLVRQFLVVADRRRHAEVDGEGGAGPPEMGSTPHVRHASSEGHHVVAS